MVAHRLSTVAKCDIIYYLDKGKIRYQGTYNELFEFVRNSGLWPRPEKRELVIL